MNDGFGLKTTYDRMIYIDGRIPFWDSAVILLRIGGDYVLGERGFSFSYSMLDNIDKQNRGW